MVILMNVQVIVDLSNLVLFSRSELILRQQQQEQ